MKIRDIVYACEILGINKTIKEQDSEEVICQKLSDRHYRNISKEAVLKKIANFERTLVSKPNNTVLMEKKQVCERILQTLEKGDLLSQVDLKERNNYQEEIRAEFLVLKSMAENLIYTDRKLLYKISPEYFNIFSLEELEKIAKQKKSTSNGKPLSVFSAEFLEMIRGLNDPKYAQSYQLLRTALLEKLGKSFYEPQMYERLKEVLAVIVKDNAMQRGKNTINPTEEAANYFSKQIIPYCENSEELKMPGKREAAMILLEVPGFVTYFARPDRNMEITMDLSESETADTIFEIIAKRMGKSVQQIQVMASKLVPFLNLEFKMKNMAEETVNTQDLSLVKQYVLQEADKFYNEIDDRLITIQSEISQKNGDYEKAEMLYQNVERRFQSWNFQHKEMKQYETAELSSAIPSFSGKMRQDERHIREIQQRIEEYKGWMKAYADSKQKEIYEMIKLSEAYTLEFEKLKTRMDEFDESYSEASLKGKAKKEKELFLLYDAVKTLNFGYYIQKSEAIFKKYPNSADLKAVLSRTVHQRNEILKITKKLEEIEDNLDKAKSKRKFRRKMCLIAIVIAAVFILNAGVKLSKKIKVMSYAKKITAEDIASLRHCDEDGWLMEMQCYKDSKDYGVAYTIEDIKVGKMNKDGRIPIQYRINDGIVNAVYYEELGWDMRADYYLYYDHCEIRGIDIIGTWYGPWNWEDGITLNINYYENETGTLSGEYKHGFTKKEFSGTLMKETGIFKLGSHELRYNPIERGFEVIAGPTGGKGNIISKVQPTEK